MANNTVFVLLAGGKSERMGFPKGLLPYKNTYWILEQLQRISKTPIREVYIGLGFDYQRYFEAIPWFKKAIRNEVLFMNLAVKISINSTPELGFFSTIQNVLNTIACSSDILLNPVDTPLLNNKELQKIIKSTSEITFPNFEGKNGHPIKMKASFWKSLIHLDLNNAASRLDYQLKKVSPAKISTIEVSDRTILYNLNTKSNWNSYLKECF